MARAVSVATGIPRPKVLRSLLCFFGCCLLFVLISCSSAGSTTNTPTITVAPTAPVGHHVIYTGHGGAAVISVAWSPDGTRIASAGNDKTVQVWDPTTRHTLLTYSGHTAVVQAVAWSPDGTRIASAGGDGMVVVWQPER